MAVPVRPRATYADVLAAPEHMTAQVIDGELHLHPRPARRHLRAASALGGFLFGAFDAGNGGPGGWVVIHEPELHFGEDILVPDLGAWREERYPGDRDDDDAYYVTAPDWVAEVLSSSTARIDRIKKMPIYARERIPHVWIVDPRDRTVEVYRLTDSGYVLATTWGDEDGTASLPPFDAVPIPASAIWGKRRPQP